MDSIGHRQAATYITLQVTLQLFVKHKKSNTQGHSTAYVKARALRKSYTQTSLQAAALYRALHPYHTCVRHVADARSHILESTITKGAVLAS